MEAVLTINEIMKESADCAQAKGWYDKGERNVGEVLMLMVSELAEACEDWRAGRPLDAIGIVDNGKPVGFPIELADCIIRIADTAARHGIDLEQAILLKMNYNRTRPYRHGNKVA